MPPRIVHVISSPTGLGGAERVLIDLVKGGADRGWQQLVLQPFASDWSELETHVRAASFEPLPARHPVELPRLRDALQRKISDFAPDVVHAHLFHAGVAVASLRQQSDALRVWSHHHGSMLVDQRRRWSHRLEALAAHRYDYVVAVSQSVQQFLVQSCRLSRERAPIIQNGWQGDPLPRPARRQGERVVCVANFRPEKQHDVLVRAFARVHAQRPNARLRLVGDGALRHQVTKLVAELGLGSFVEFSGAVGNVWPELRDADVFALASSSETFGIAVLEAMAAGLPVVAPAVGGLPELVTHARTGLLVQPNDAVALADALVTLLNDEDARRTLGDEAASVAATMRSDRMVAAYFDLYTSGIQP